MDEKGSDDLPRLSTVHRINSKFHEERFTCSRIAFNPEESTRWIHPPLIFVIFYKPIASVIGIRNFRVSVLLLRKRQRLQAFYIVSAASHRNLSGIIPCSSLESWTQTERNVSMLSIYLSKSGFKPCGPPPIRPTPGRPRVIPSIGRRATSTLRYSWSCTPLYFTISEWLRLMGCCFWQPHVAENTSTSTSLGPDISHLPFTWMRC